MIVTQRISITMDAILAIGGSSGVLTCLSPISSSDFSTIDTAKTYSVPSGAKLAVFYNIGFEDGRGDMFISVSPMAVAVPSSGSIYVRATGIKATEAWETGKSIVASLSSTSLEVETRTSGMVLWLG